MRLHLANGIRVEHVDGEAIVLDRTGSFVHRVTGDALEVLLLAERDVEMGDLPPGLLSALDSLVDAGVVSTSGLSRRKLLLAGGVATVGITSFALATPAAAASPCTNGAAGDELPQTYNTTAVGAGAQTAFTFKPRKGVTSVKVHAWGGGGGHGMGSATQSGDGGGGGGYSSSVVTVTECTEYDVRVGGGGAFAPGTAMAGNGGDSYFLNTSTVLARGGGGATARTTVGAGATLGVGDVRTTGGSGGENTGQSGGGGGGSGGSATGGGAGGKPPSDSTQGAAGAAGTGDPAGALGGVGGAGRQTPASTGNTGGTPGGGAGSNADNGAGANGAPGRVCVTPSSWTNCSPP